MKDKVENHSLIAWVGEDEFTKDGSVGLKQALVPAGYVALAAMDYHLNRLDKLKPQMEAQAAAYGKRIYLVRFTFAEILDQTKAGE